MSRGYEVARRRPRPLIPSDDWVEFESSYADLLAHELKERDPALYRRLQVNDELHFVPMSEGERAHFAPKEVEIPTVAGQKFYSVGDMHLILRSTAQEAGIKDYAALRTTYVSVIAANQRSSVRWAGQSRKNKTADISSRAQYVHSPQLTHAVIIEFVNKYASVGESTRARWLAVLVKRFGSSV